MAAQNVIHSVVILLDLKADRTRHETIAVVVHGLEDVCRFKYQKSDNLQYNMLGRWDERLLDQTSDVPSIIFFS